MTHSTDLHPRPAISPDGIDSAVCVVAAALMAIGIVMAVSSTASLPPPPSGYQWWFSTPVKQSAFSLFAFCVMLFVARRDYRFWIGKPGRMFLPAVWLLVLVWILLVAVLVPDIGVERNGARRWLPLTPAAMNITFQPSEPCKAALVLFLAAFIAMRGERMKSLFAGLFPAVMVIGVCAALVGIEDFGTAALLGVVGGALLWYGGTRRGYLLAAAVPALVGFAGLIWAKPYRFERLIGFMHVWEDRQGRGYHAVQSLVAIASGGWWGQGLGHGVQKYGYLPEAPSDFVFAVICEELGIIGGITIIGLFLALIWQGGRAVRRAPDEFGRLVALGATLTIGLQAAINMGVVTVSLPTKGIALPFVSAGGSSTVFLGFLAGLLASVGRRALPAEEMEEAAKITDLPELPDPSAIAVQAGIQS